MGHWVGSTRPLAMFVGGAVVVNIVNTSNAFPDSEHFEVNLVRQT